MMIYSFHSTFYILLGVFVVFLFFFMIIRSVQSENSTSTNNNGHKSINLLCSVSDEKYYWMMQLVLYTSYGCFSNSMTKCWFVYFIWSGLTVFDSRGGASFGRMLESKRCRCAGSSILFFSCWFTCGKQTCRAPPLMITWMMMNGIRVIALCWCLTTQNRKHCSICSMQYDPASFPFSNRWLGFRVWRIVNRMLFFVCHNSPISRHANRMQIHVICYTAH